MRLFTLFIALLICARERDLVVFIIDSEMSSDDADGDGTVDESGVSVSNGGVSVAGA